MRPTPRFCSQNRAAVRTAAERKAIGKAFAEPRHRDVATSIARYAA